MTSRKKGARAQGSAQPRVASLWPRRLLWIGGAVVGLGLIVWMATSIASENVLAGVPEGTEQVAIGPREHFDGDIYSDDEIPAGGPHASIWQNCGFYGTPVPAENVVHSLEHAAVWITYEPDLPEDQVQILRGFTGPADKVLVSPIANQGAPIIATAWGNQLELLDASDSRLEQFVNEFEGSFSAPEPGGACNRGVGSPLS